MACVKHDWDFVTGYCGRCGELININEFEKDTVIDTLNSMPIPRARWDALYQLNDKELIREIAINLGSMFDL